MNKKNPLSTQDSASVTMRTKRRSRLDALDAQLIAALQRDARLSIRELGRRIGVSAPTVSDRLGRLEAAGVIRGYGAVVALDAIGYNVLAFVNVYDAHDKFHEVMRWAHQNASVLECHVCTGRFVASLKVAVTDIEALNSLVMELNAMGVQCETSIVLNSPVSGKTPELPGYSDL